MRITTLSILAAIGLTAVGCAAGMQGLAVLGSMRHGGSQPTLSEFAADQANYSRALLAAAAGDQPVKNPAKTAPPAPDYTGISACGSASEPCHQQHIAPQAMQAQAAPAPRPIEPAVPVAEYPAIAECEPAEADSPFRVTRCNALSHDEVDEDLPSLDEMTYQLLYGGRQEESDDESVEQEATIDEISAVETVAELADAPGDSLPLEIEAGTPAGETLVAQGPVYDEATGYPVALGNSEWQEGEVIATPEPTDDAFKPHTDEAFVDRFSRKLTDVPIDIRPTAGVMPDDPAATKFAETARVDPRQMHQVPGIVCSCTPWTICFRPLYFEEVALERYGDKAECGAQPVISGVRFFSNVALLPYKMRVRPPRSCVCSNGFSRIGDCPLPGYGECVWRWDAAAIEMAAVTGVVFILP